MRALLDIEPSRASSESDILLNIRHLYESSQRYGLRTNFKGGRVEYGFTPVLARVIIALLCVIRRYYGHFSNASDTEGQLSIHK